MDWWWPCGDEAHDENYIVTILRNDYTSASTLKREREREREKESDRERDFRNKQNKTTDCMFEFKSDQREPMKSTFSMLGFKIRFLSLRKRSLTVFSLSNKLSTSTCSF